MYNLINLYYYKLISFVLLQIRV